MRETNSWHLITSGLIFQLFHYLHQFRYCWLPCYLFLGNAVVIKNTQFFGFFQMVRSFFIEKKFFLAMVSQRLSKDIRQFSKMNHDKNESLEAYLFIFEITPRSQFFFFKKKTEIEPSSEFITFVSVFTSKPVNVFCLHNPRC